MTDAKRRRDLVIVTIASAAGATVGLLGPEASVMAAAAAPSVTVTLSAVWAKIAGRRIRNVEETLVDAAETASMTVEEFLEMAVSGERSHELLARVVMVAQDTTMRDKRRALGRALAAGVAGDSARVDEELLFVRAIADLDPPHIRLLSLIGSEAPSKALLNGGWMSHEIVGRDPGLADVLPALLATLELHTLILDGGIVRPVEGGRVHQYSVTARGQNFLRRLTEDPIE